MPQFTTNSPSGASQVLSLPSADKYYILQKKIGPDPYFDGRRITAIYEKRQIYNEAKDVPHLSKVAGT